MTQDAPMPPPRRSKKNKARVEAAAATPAPHADRPLNVYPSDRLGQWVEEAELAAAGEV